MLVLHIISSMLKLIALIYCLFRFVLGDKEDVKTLWYGIVMIISLM